MASQTLAEVTEQLKDELRKELKQELKQELEQELKQELDAIVEQQVANQLRMMKAEILATLAQRTAAVETRVTEAEDGIRDVANHAG
jgi:putative heme iron utilization protein